MNWQTKNPGSRHQNVSFIQPRKKGTETKNKETNTHTQLIPHSCSPCSSSQNEKRYNMHNYVARNGTKNNSSSTMYHILKEKREVAYTSPSPRKFTKNTKTKKQKKKKFRRRKYNLRNPGLDHW